MLTKKFVMHSLCIFYIFLMTNIWLFYEFTQFAEEINFCFMSFIHTFGAAFIFYCFLYKQQQHAFYEGPQNEMNRGFTACGIGLIIGISYKLCTEKFNALFLISNLSKMLFIFLQIFYISCWNSMIIVPDGMFSIFGLANLLLINALNFLSEWIISQQYNKIAAAKIANSNQINTIAIFYFILGTGIQHSSWCFYTILKIWETLWKNEPTTNQIKSKNDHKIQLINFYIMNMQFFNASPFYPHHLNAMHFV